MNTTTTYGMEAALPSATGGDELLRETGTPASNPPVTAVMVPRIFTPAVLVPAAAMACACIGAIALASSMERGSPWAGMNALASGMGLSNRRRPSGRFHGGTAAALGLIAGGALGLSVIEGAVAGATAGKMPPGIATALGGALTDKLLLRRGVFEAMARTLGMKGTIAKYAAMGLAAALTLPRT